MKVGRTAELTYIYVLLCNLGCNNQHCLILLNCTTPGGSGGAGVEDISVCFPSRANFMALYISCFQKVLGIASPMSKWD